MNILYSLGIGLYIWALRIAALFNSKAAQMIAGRKGLLAKIQQDFAQNTRKVIWLHCASLGEFEQGRPLIDALRLQYPAARIVLTFFSPSGYEIRKGYPQADFVYYLPFDTASNAGTFINALKPSLVVFVKYEFWYHYLRLCSTRGIQTIVVSAIFRPNQPFFKSYGGFFRKILANLSHIFVQNETSVKLLKDIGLEQVSLAGDTRFDRVNSLAQNPGKLPIIENFVNGQPTLVFGSAWPADLDLLWPIIDYLPKHLKIIIAPHEIDSGQIDTWIKNLKPKAVKYSELSNESPAQAYHILFIDNIGMLNKIYSYAQICYIGGAFGKGLHNILEAAAYAKPIVFGSANYQKFDEATQLLALGGAFTVANAEQLKSIVQKLSSDEAFYRHSAGISEKFVQSNKGATAKILNYIAANSNL